MDDAARSNRTLLVGHAVSWVLACFFAVALVSAAAVSLAQVLGRPALTSDRPFMVAVEGVVHLAIAVGVFALVRRVERPRWYWAVAPVGYVASFASFVLVVYLLGATNSLPQGAEWTYVVCDVAATALGAWLVLRGARTAPTEQPPVEPLP
jgi:energy-converting hydrogenase Eha subunit A